MTHTGIRRSKDTKRTLEDNLYPQPLRLCWKGALASQVDHPIDGFGERGPRRDGKEMVEGEVCKTLALNGCPITRVFRV